MNRIIATDGTLGFLVNENGIRVITLADGTSVTYNPAHQYVAMCYSAADTLIYVATMSSIYSIDPSDGTTVLIGLMDNVQSMAPIAADSLLIVRGASMVDYTPSTEGEVFINKDVN